MSRASDLLKLQQIDSQLDRHNERLAEISLVLANEQSVCQSRSRLETAQATAEEVRGANRLVQEESNVVEHKRKASEARLYGGLVKNPKELQDLSNEVSALGRRLTQLEDVQLEAMFDQDEAETAEASAFSEHIRIESEWKNTQRNMTEEQLEREHEIARLQDEREVALAPISTKDHQIYEKLRKSKGLVAVILIKEGVCAACGMAPSASRIQQTRSGFELIQCGNCFRILCLS